MWHICDMKPERWNSVVREVLWRQSLLGNGLVIRSSNSWGFCMLQLTANHGPVSGSGKLLLVLASTVVLGSESSSTWPYFSLSSLGVVQLYCQPWSCQLVRQVNCCWPLPSQLFLVLSPVGLTTMFYCLTTFPWSCLCLSGKLLLALASTVILGSKFHGTHDQILLSDGSGSLQNSLLSGLASLYNFGSDHRESTSFDSYSVISVLSCASVCVSSLSMLGNSLVNNFLQQQLTECVPAATNMHATIEELLGTSFSMQSVPYQRKLSS
jgi:hypothetical protein